MAPHPHTLPLILVVDGDRRQRAEIAALVRERVAADLCQAASAAEALAHLHGRVPDLILTSPLLSPRDEDAVAAHLRSLGKRAAHVQTIRIPVLHREMAVPAPEARRFLARFLAPAPAAPPGCDPGVFADEIVQYLARVTAHRGASGKSSRTDPADAFEAAVDPGAQAAGALDAEWPSEHELAPAPPPLTLLSLEEFLGRPADPHRDARRPAPASGEPAAASGSDPVLTEFQEALLALELGVGSAELMLLDSGDRADAPQPDPLAAFASEADLAPHAGSPEATSAEAVVRQPGAQDTGQRPAAAGDAAPAADTPMQDEWGLFDPDRCGFAALVKRLDRSDQDTQ